MPSLLHFLAFNRPSSSRGMTLMELLITLAVASVLLTLATPSIINLYSSNALTTQANEIVSLLNYARSEAIGRNRTILFCRANNLSDSTCVTSKGSWKNWLILSGTSVIRRGTLSNRAGMILTSNFTNDTITFSPDGLARNGANLVNGQFLQIQTATSTRCVVMGAGSRTNVKNITGNC